MKKPNTPEFQVAVIVKSEFIPEQSSIETNKYYFTYTVTIENQGVQSVQLLSRHWIIRNANNERYEVKGDGVVGEQPIIKPGTIYSYTSGTEINTPVGSMLGSYHMIAEEGTEFDAKISEFELNMPRTLH